MRRGLSSSTLLLCFSYNAIVATAFAQENTDEVSQAESGTIERVIVTADRRGTDITDSPVSISVIKSETLESLSSAGGDIRILAARVPSLNIESSNGRTFPRFYIRGYGNTDFTSFASQPVSLVYDDVVLENAALKGFPAFDLEGIEVLRGPQGTLFGRNTPAGVVKFNSVKPTIGSTDGYFTASAGTYSTTNLEGAFNVPINDDMAARVSLLYQHRDDWVDNEYYNTSNELITENDSLGGYDDSAARIQLLYEPMGADFKALFNVHVRNLDDGTARLFRANIIEKGSNNLVDGFDAEKVSMDGENTQSYTSAGGSARLTWFYDDFTVHSISSYESVTHYYTRGDIDGGYGASYAEPYGPGYIPFSVETGGGLADHAQLTQELRIASDLSSDLNWQAGVFYFYEDVTADSFTYDTLFGSDATHEQNQQKNVAWAAYGSAGYNVSDRLEITGGLRYTYDDKDYTEGYGGDSPFSQSKSDSKVTWDLSAHYTLNDDTSLYSRIATGFRAPTFGSLSATDNEITVAESETIVSYEAGIKADLFDRRARLNFNVFYYEVSDQQLTAVGGTANETRLINADKTVGQGAELDFEAYITPNLNISLSGSYNDTEIQDPNLYVSGCGTDIDGSQLCTILDPVSDDGLYSIDGNSLPQAAEWIGNASAHYVYETSDSGEIYVYADIAYSSEVSFFLYDSEEFRSDGSFEAGLKLGYSWDNGKYDVAVFCRNCTDEVNLKGGLDFDNRTAFINDPRIIGAQFKTQF